MSSGSRPPADGDDIIGRLEASAAHTPDDPSVRAALAHEYLNRGRFEDARDELLVAMAYAPRDTALHVLFARCCRKSGDLEQARQVLDEVVATAPDDAAANFELGLVAQRERDIDCAEQAFLRVTQVDPRRADAWINLGVIQLNQRGAVKAARSSLEHALAIQPDSVEARVNLALVMQYSDGPLAAARYLEQMLDAHPDSGEVHWHMAIASLLARDYSRGWPHYEWRDRVYGGAHSRRFPYARWRGEALTGKRVLVYGEQGLGDEIMFASCLPDVVFLAGQCLIECHSRLQPLFARSFPQAVVRGTQRDGDRSWLAGAGTVDFQSPIGSLPLYFRGDVERFPKTNGFLKPDPSKVAAWRTRLERLGPEPKVGLSWRGGTADTRTSLRSVGIDQIGAMLKSRHVHWVNLQHAARADEVTTLRTAHNVVLHHDERIGADLDETAALMCALDLIVTVANTNVHLAGALGRPARVLVSALPEWRYGSSGSTMDWYPSVTLIRQKTPGVWEDAWGEALADIA